MKFFALCAVLLLSACGVSSVPAVAQHHIHGVIQSLDSKDHIAMIKHGKIEGFMEAMTMEYPVKDEKAFNALRVGETIDGTLFVQDTNYWVGDVRETK